MDSLADRMRGTHTEQAGTKPSPSAWTDSMVVQATEWKKINFDFNDGNETNPFCKQDDWQCLNYTNLPHPRSGHVAIIYKTFNQTQCELFVHSCYGKKRKDLDQCKLPCRKDNDTLKANLRKQWEEIESL